MTTPSETRDSELVAQAESLARTDVANRGPRHAGISDDDLRKALRHRAGLPETCATDAYVMMQAEQRIKAIDRLTSTGEALYITPATLEMVRANPDKEYHYVVVAAKHGPYSVPLYASPREGHVEVPVETLRNAVLSCPHTITSEEIVLRRSDKMDGNALNQLHQRLAAALIPTKPEAKEPELETLRAALRYARPLLVKYAYTQGNSADFVREITAPVDAALQSKKPE